MSDAKIGRPEKIAGGGKARLVIRLSQEQNRRISDLAHAAGLPKSEYARAVLERAAVANADFDRALTIALCSL